MLVIFTVTTASSIFKASQSRTTYTATVALQVNDPQERSSGLVNIPSVGGLNLFVDPIESEIQVLGSATIKATVVDSRGMRLARVPVEDARSLIMRDVWVAPDVPDYQSFRLIEEFEGRYDQVIIDSPPVLAVTDSAILAVPTDGVVIVLRSRETEQRATERSVDQLRHRHQQRCGRPPFATPWSARVRRCPEHRHDRKSGRRAATCSTTTVTPPRGRLHRAAGSGCVTE